MPRVDFDQLPDGGRLWVFASDRPLDGEESALLLAAVDHFLESWTAHGAPLRSARDWRDDRFLGIGIDPTAEQASGCSIDGLFRELQRVQSTIHTSLVGGGRVFYRDARGRPQLAQRSEIARLSAAGEIEHATPVFDTSITEVGAWRTRFERPARDTWLNGVIQGAQASQASSRSATNSSSVRNG